MIDRSWLQQWVTLNTSVTKQKSHTLLKWNFSLRGKTYTFQAFDVEMLLDEF